MNQYPFYTEPLAEPIESDAVERLYLFQERVAIHVFHVHIHAPFLDAHRFYSAFFSVPVSHRHLQAEL